MMMKIIQFLSLGLVAASNDFSRPSQAQLRIGNLHTSITRNLSGLSDACHEDMMELELDASLSESLQTSMDSFTYRFQSSPLEFCKATQVDGRMQMDCLVDYQHYTGGYVTQCSMLEAEHYPLNLILECSNSAMDLEMEMSNVPVCIAHNCDKDQVENVMKDVLRSSSTDHSLFHEDDLSCTFYQREDHYTPSDYQVNGAKIRRAVL